MKFNLRRKSPRVLEFEVSYFQLFPFLVCLALLLLPIVSFLLQRSLATLTPLILFLPLCGFFIYFLTTKILVVFDLERNFLLIHQSRLVKSTFSKYPLGELQDVRVVLNKAVKPPATRSIEFTFKNSPPWKTLGTNLSTKQVQTIDRHIEDIQSFLNQEIQRSPHQN